MKPIPENHGVRHLYEWSATNIRRFCTRNDGRRKINKYARSTTVAMLNIVLLVVANAHADITSGLVAHWKLDQTGADTSAPDTIGTHNGTVTGTAQWTAGKIRNAFDFDQATVISCGTNSALDLTSQGTIAAWVDADDLGGGGGGRVYDRGNVSLYLTVASSTNARFVIGGGPGTSTIIPFPFSQPHHIAVTWSGTTVKYYLDGSLDRTVTIAAPTSSPSSTARIGDNVNNDRDFDGRIDDLRIYDRALTEDDIDELYVWRDGWLNPLVRTNGAPGPVDPLFGGPIQ
jgi:hypothetical protein